MGGGSFRQMGFILTEVLIALGVSGLILSGIIAVFIMQNRSYAFQEQMTETVQTARAALDMMVREVRMAGHDPAGAGFDGIVYDPATLQLRADLGGDSSGAPPDGDTNDPNESVAYRYDPVDHQIDRNTGGGNQPFAEDIEAFTFTCLDGDGHPTTVSGDIREVRLTITVRTGERDPHYGSNGGYRTYTLGSAVTPPNLACR